MGTIKSVQRSMGYRRADTCANCKHLLETPQGTGRVGTAFVPTRAECKKGGFYISRLAVCQQHETEKGPA